MVSLLLTPFESMENNWRARNEVDSEKKSSVDPGWQGERGGCLSCLSSFSLALGQGGEGGRLYQVAKTFTALLRIFRERLNAKHSSVGSISGAGMMCVRLR